MKKLRKKVYIAAGFNTVSMGTGRSEFHPKKERPGLEYYIETAGKGTLAQVNDADNIEKSIDKRSSNNTAKIPTKISLHRSTT